MQCQMETIAGNDDVGKQTQASLSDCMCNISLILSVSTPAALQNLHQTRELVGCKEYIS